METWLQFAEEAKGDMTLEQAVWVDPDRMSGTPCFPGSRLPV